jgi:predicted transport protein
MNREEMTEKAVATIEEMTGTKLNEWVKRVKTAKLTKHKEIRDFFIEKHGLSYGYANTLAHAVRDMIEGVKSEDSLVEEQYTSAKADLKPIYDAVIKVVEKFGKDVEIAPKKAYVSLRRKKQFAIVQPSTNTRMDIGLIIKGKNTTERLEEGGKWNGMCTHRVRVTEKSEINPELIGWLKEAYESAG